MYQIKTYNKKRKNYHKNPQKIFQIRQAPNTIITTTTFKEKRILTTKQNFNQAMNIYIKKTA